MELTYRNTVTVEDYQKLRAVVDWMPLCRTQALAGLENSTYVIGCYAQDSLVGFARVLWDGGALAYLSDVMVAPQCQGKGIGAYMVKEAIGFVRSQLKEGWKIKIVLLATKDREEFYEKLGFRRRPAEDAGAGMDLWLP